MADEQEREQPVTAEKAEETPGLPAEKPRGKGKPRRSRAKKMRTPRPDDGKRHLRPWRVVVARLSLGILIWSALPLGVGVKNIGVVLGIAAGLLGMVWGFWPVRRGKKKRKGMRRVLHAIVMGLIGIVAALGIVITACMTAAAVRRPAQPEATVIVLGAKVNGEQPCRMLADRLRAAAAYLEEHPQAMCVVSGGQGADESFTEAHVMKKYLVERFGIAPERIFEEDRSTSTSENIRYSLAIIRSEELCGSVVIATQEFHQYRAAALARRAGVTEVGAATCLSPTYLLLTYWIRECAAVCRMWLLGR